MKFPPAALRLMIRIGGSVEQCLLDRARKILAGRSGGDRPDSVTVRDVLDSLQALLNDQAYELRSSLSEILNKEVAELRKLRQAG